VVNQERIYWIAWSPTINKNWEAYNHERIATNTWTNFHLQSGFCHSGYYESEIMISQNFIIYVIICVLLLLLLGGGLFYFFNKKKQRDDEHDDLE